MFRRLSVFLVSVSFLIQTNPLQSYFLKRSSALSSVGNYSSHFRFPLSIAYKQLNAFSPLNAYPLLNSAALIGAGGGGPPGLPNNYDSKQVSNTLWNLLSIARFLLCTTIIANI